MKQLLIRYIKKGLIQKLKENRGLYILKKKDPEPWFVANKLLRPSYISLETALAHYGAIPESVYGVTSATPLGTRTFQPMNMVFAYHKIKKSAYTGYRSLEKGNVTILLAEPEKAMVDWAPSLFLNLLEKMAALKPKNRIQGLPEKPVVPTAMIAGINPSLS